MKTMNGLNRESCPWCGEKGFVGGLYDGDEWIDEETCAFCFGSGYSDSTEQPSEAVAE